MPTLTAALVPEGALVEILLGLSSTRASGLRAALRPVPSPVSVQALLDTGAKITGVDSSVVQAVGLPVRTTVLANLPAHGGMTVGLLYDASLTLVHPSGNSRDNLE